MSLLKTKAILKPDNKWENISAKLKALGASLMFPLLLLAFASLVLGITYIFPSEWVTTQATSKIVMTIFHNFPYLVFYSLIITFHKNQVGNTYINATLFLFTIITIQKIILSVTDIDSYYLSNSVFSMILTAVTFIIVDRLIKIPFLWVLIAFFFSLVLVPIFMTLALIVRFIGYLIGLCPFGINAFLYGSINRLLLPFGLHSLMIPTFTYTAVGGSLEIYEGSELINTINGDSAIWTYMYTHQIDFQSVEGSFSYEGNYYSYILSNSNSPGQYQVGFLPLTTFIFPIMGISYVVINGWEKGKLLFFSTLITMCSGLTEVTEYAYLFTNIYLYVLEIIIVGLSFMLCNILDVSVWISTGWFIDIILFGIIPSVKGFETNWIWIPVIGITLGIVFAILFNLLDRLSKKSVGL